MAFGVSELVIPALRSGRKAELRAVLFHTQLARKSLTCMWRIVRGR
jgi:hypothetical protein